MTNTVFCSPLTIAEIETLHNKYGLVIEINDGEVVSANFE